MLETEKKHQCTECKTTFIDTGIIERFEEIVEDDDGKLSVKISSPEAGYRCLLRHIRNAFAHNNVLFFENGNILLKDYQRDGDKQRDKKVTAAILIKFDTLFEWIRLIETDQERIEE